jgi:nucleoside-diphosphate-sugar epimerase
LRVLLVGSSSSVGEALIPELRKFSEVIAAGKRNAQIPMDLRDPLEKIDVPDNVDVLILAAAHFGGREPIEILECEGVNVLGTLKLCCAAHQKGVKHIVLISSMSAVLKESSRYYNIYALSKKHAEDVVSFFCSTNPLAFTVLRPSQIFGNSDSFRKHQPLIYNMADQAERDQDITIYGSNDALRNYIHIDDLTRIIAEVIQKRVVGTYSCTYPSDYAYSQIAKAAQAAFSSNGSVLFLKDKPDIPDNIFENDDSLYRKIDFYPQVSIEEGMRRIAKFRKGPL